MHTSETSKGHIIFITDIRNPRETDLLQGNESRDLVITNDEGEVVKIEPAPAGGWTHDKLCLLADIEAKGSFFDAYLGSPVDARWIGSTEV